VREPQTDGGTDESEDRHHHGRDCRIRRHRLPN
jgi:hypothetical protein